jgi:hypothetical protein
MIRELHELSSIGAGDDTYGPAGAVGAVNLTDVTGAGQDEAEGVSSMHTLLPLPSAIKAVAADYSGREDAVEAGLADLSVSTVGDPVDGALSTSDMAAATGSAVGEVDGATAEGKTAVATGSSGRPAPKTSWDDIVSSTGQAVAEGVGSPSPFASPPFSSSPAAIATATDVTAPELARGANVGEEGLATDDAERLALARLTEKVATLSSINARLEEQLQEEDAAAAESATGPHVCIFRAAVTELLDFDPNEPRILRNIEVDQIVHVDQVCLTQSGQPRGRLRTGGWVSMINRQGVVQFRPTSSTGDVHDVAPPRA